MSNQSIGGARSAGFSLIEMLAVVFVVVLLTSLVSLNVGSGSADIDRDSEVRHVSSLLSYALTEAEMSGADYGLLIYVAEGLDEPVLKGQWLRRFDQGWSAPIRQNTALETLEFDESVELELRLDEQPPVDLEPLEPDTNPRHRLCCLLGVK